jgi:adenine-specific DNA-methyltransferase
MSTDPEDNTLCEPQTLFGFFEPAQSSAPTHLATGGLCSFQAEPKHGRAAGKVRELGQVATPPLLASGLAAWVTSLQPTEILDPALGLGNLLNACRPLAPQARLAGIEIDPDLIAEARHTTPVGTRIQCADYLRTRTPLAPAIIANPPYIKAARLGWSESDWAWAETTLDCRLDRLTNAYVLFLLKIWRDLAPGGRAAVLIPGEFLNANYGESIKEKLLRDIRPVATLVLDPAINAFDTALTTSAILLLEKSTHQRTSIPAYLVSRLDLLHPSITAITQGHVPDLSIIELARLKPYDKWLNRILGQHQEHDAFTHRVGDFFRCSRGIATGANDYFCLRPSELDTHQLSARDFTPCIAKAPDVVGLVFNQHALQRLQAEDKRCWLLAPDNTHSAPLRRYLEHGELSGISARFLPSHRSVWYQPENRAPAHAWIGVFSRDSLKCVLNLTEARHLTCFHGAYARSDSVADAALFVLFLNSSLGRIAIRQVQRFYGDGLNKLEPKDVESIPCPSLAPLGTAKTSALVQKLQEIDALPTPRRQREIDALAMAYFDLNAQAVA